MISTYYHLITQILSHITLTYEKFGAKKKEKRIKHK